MGNEQSRQPLGEYAGGRGGGGVSWINEKSNQQQRQHYQFRMGMEYPRKRAEFG